MGRNRRDRRDPNHLVVHITNRTEQGLPFIHDNVMKEMLGASMARSQERHPVQICHFLFMSNHYHIILAGQAKNISGFIGEMQSDIARKIKRMTPQYKGRVWAGRFKEQKLATPEDVYQMIIYLYLNPVKAGLVEHVSDWKGFSSFDMYKKESFSYYYRWTAPRFYKTLPSYISQKKSLEIRKDIKSHSEAIHELRITPDAWKKCFSESKIYSKSEIYQRIMNDIGCYEKQYAIVHNNKFLGEEKITKQSIHKMYYSKQKKRTPFLKCCINELRIMLIAEYRNFCAQCKEAYKAWKKRDFFAPYIYGAYRPGMNIVGDLSKILKSSFHNICRIVPIEYC